MPRLLEHVRTLVYYDGPQLIVAADPVGTKYLCMLAEELEERDKFVCAPISNGRLRAFERGELDLLQIFSEPEAGELYEGDSEYSAETFLLAITLAEQIPEYWYPEEGFFLAPIEDVTAEARDRNKAVVHLALQPPEAREGTQIDVQHLANGLRLFQRLIRHAYDKAVLAVKKDIRDEQSLSDASNYQMEAFAFSPGSFAVDMQSKTSADMLGYVNLARALTLVDEAVTAANDPEAAAAFMREHRGRFLTTYRSLLQYIVENDSPLTYEWSIPQYSLDRHNDINIEKATEIYKILTTQEALTTEQVTLVGVVTAVNTEKNTWTLRSDEDRENYSGKLAEGSYIRLDGITVKTQRYRFYCEETLFENPSTGEDQTERILLNYDKL